MKKLLLILIVTLLTGMQVKAAIINPGFAWPNSHSDSEPALQQTALQNSDSLISALLPLINSDSILSYIKHLQGYGTRFSLSPNHKEIALWLQTKLQSFGYASVVLDSFQVTEEWPFYSGIFVTTWQYNVVADLTGSANPEIHYITGGHYDSAILFGDPYIACPGADDNASGVAAALEIARVLKIQNFDPLSTIRFVLFASEELGTNGSNYYVAEALDADEPIPMMINMDMIAHEPADTGWMLHLHAYKGSEWLSAFTQEMAEAHTSLSARITTSNEEVGSDSDPFFTAGFPVIFLQEDNFSTDYHTLNDVDSNLNIPYCAEITRLACSMLIRASSIPSRVNFRIYNPGDGQSLTPVWERNPEANIAGYNVYIGTSSLVYDTMFYTTDTLFNLTGLQSGTIYYIAVTAVNTMGAEGLSHELSDIPADATMNQGILIIDDSEGGYYNPTDAKIDTYYRSLCSTFDVTEYDATANGPVDLTDLAPYSSVIWHINLPIPVSALQASLPEIIQYLELGGNILFTLFQPTRMFTGTAVFPAVHRKNSFLYEMAGIDSSFYSSSSAFIRAQPLNAAYPLLKVDTLKTIPPNDHHLQYTDAIFPVDPSDAIYAFDTDYDSLSQQALMKGNPIGVAYNGNGFHTVTLSFPLYYIDSVEAQTFMHYVLEDIFGEIPSGLETYPPAVSGITIFPNPSNGKINIRLVPGMKSPQRITLSDISGRCVYESTQFTGVLDVGYLKSGLYFLSLYGENSVAQLRVLIVK